MGEGMTYEEWANSPLGQSANAAIQQTIAKNVQIADAAMKAERDRIAIAQGQAKADLWYKQQQVKLAQQAHELAVLTQQQTYSIQVGQLTGMFNGQPTLANLAQTAQFTGVYNGQPTLQAKNQEQQYALQQAQLALAQLTQQQQHEIAQGTLNLATLSQQQRNALDQAQLLLNQAGITGEFNGKPTLAALAQQQQNEIAWANVSGQLPGGQQTLAARLGLGQLGLQQAAQQGYGPGGAPTLAREQAAANAALQAGQLGASLRGPADWAKYLQAANGIANSPVSNLVASVPGGLGATTGETGGPMTLEKLWGDFGVMPGQGGSQPGAGPGATTPESGWYGPGGTGVPGGPAGGAPLTEQELSRAQAITARRAQLQAAGEGDVSPEDAAELQRYIARGYQPPAPTPAPAPIPAPAPAPTGGGMTPTPQRPMYGPATGPLTENSPEYAKIQAMIASGQITPEEGAQQWAVLTGQGGGANEPGVAPGGQGPYMGTPLPGAGGFGDTMFHTMGGNQGDLASQWAANYGVNLSNPTGSYSSAPAGGMRPGPYTDGGMPQWQQGWNAFAQNPWQGGGGQSQRPMRYDPSAYAPKPAVPAGMMQQGYTPYSLTGAIGQQATNPWKPTAQQLGFANDDEMNTVKGYFSSPNQAPSGWWESKSPTQRKYLGGLNEFWGGDNDTFMNRYANSRTRQGSAFAAV